MKFGETRYLSHLTLIIALLGNWMLVASAGAQEIEKIAIIGRRPTGLKRMSQATWVIL